MDLAVYQLNAATVPVVDFTQYLQLSGAVTPGETLRIALSDFLGGSIFKDGLSFDNGVRLGQGVAAVGDPGKLLEDREVPLNSFSFVFRGSSTVKVADGTFPLQLISVGGDSLMEATDGTVTSFTGVSGGEAIYGTQSNHDVSFFSHGTEHLALKAGGFLQFLENGLPAATNFDIRQRGVALGFPVTVIQPSGNGVTVNANMALDVMPKGAPGDFAGSGVAWLDMCNSDCQASSAIDTQTARIGVWSDHAYFGTCSFGSVITPIPMVLGINSLEVARFDVNGLFGINEDAPTSRLDVVGTHGYDQFRLRTSYTPTGSADANGETGDIAWDADFFYVKTGAGAWKRAALSTF